MTIHPSYCEIADDVKGWLTHDQGHKLYQTAHAAPYGPFVEVGSYCGKSTVYIGAAAKELGTHLFAVDHHRGSREMQSDRENHDTTVVDPFSNQHDTLLQFRHTLHLADLEDAVIPVVAPSLVAARYFEPDLGLVFIDGDHSYAGCKADFKAWAPHVMRLGFVVFHDTTIEDIARVADEALEDPEWRMFDDTDEDMWIIQRVVA